MNARKRLFSAPQTARLSCVFAAAMLPAFAHHSFAAYDMSKKTTVAGTIKNFQWTLPHSQLTLVVPNQQGGTDEWVIEAGAPPSFVKQGWKKSDVKNGDPVTVVVNPMRDGKPGGSMVSLTRADGRVLRGGVDFEFGNATAPAAAPSDASVTETAP